MHFSKHLVKPVRPQPVPTLAGGLFKPDFGLSGQLLGDSYFVYSPAPRKCSDT